MATKKVPLPALALRLSVPAGKKRTPDTVELFPDGESVLAGGWEGVWRVELATGNVVRTYRKYEGSVCWMARVSRDGDRVVSAFGDCTLHVWNAATGVESWAAPTHDRIVTRIALSQDGTRALTVAGNNTLCSWDITARRERFVLPNKKSIAIACALAGGGRIAVYGGTDGFVRAVDLDAQRELWATSGSGWIESMDASADGKLVASTGRGKAILLWDVESGSVKRSVPLSGNSTFVTLTPDGRHVLALGKAAPVVFATDTGKPVATLSLPERIVAARFSFDGRSMVASDAKGMIHVLDLPASETGPVTG